MLGITTATFSVATVMTVLFIEWFLRSFTSALLRYFPFPNLLDYIYEKSATLRQIFTRGLEGRHEDPRLNCDVEQLASLLGCVIETHTVPTPDGFRLVLHRLRKAPDPGETRNFEFEQINFDALPGQAGTLPDETKTNDDENGHVETSVAEARVSGSNPISFVSGIFHQFRDSYIKFTVQKSASESSHGNDDRCESTSTDTGGQSQPGTVSTADPLNSACQAEQESATHADAQAKSRVTSLAAPGSTVVPLPATRTTSESSVGANGHPRKWVRNYVLKKGNQTPKLPIKLDGDGSANRQEKDTTGFGQSKSLESLPTLRAKNGVKHNLLLSPFAGKDVKRCLKGSASASASVGVGASEEVDSQESRTSFTVHRHVRQVSAVSLCGDTSDRIIPVLPPPLSQQHVTGEDCSRSPTDNDLQAHDEVSESQAQLQITRRTLPSLGQAERPTEKGELFAVFRSKSGSSEDDGGVGTAWGGGGNKKEKKSVVFLMHGLLMSSEIWLLSKESSLALHLLEEGYDVWLGNNRGNKYSWKNTRFRRDDERYWDFCVDELAAVDVPCSIEYVLKVTHHPSLTYVGFSNGSAQMFAALSTLPKLNTQVHLFIALSPACKFTTLRVDGEYLLYSLIFSSKRMVNLLFGKKAMLGLADYWRHALSPKVFAVLLELSMALLFGWQLRGVPEDLKIVFLNHIYSTGSTKNVNHWFQMLKSSKFEAYDETDASRTQGEIHVPQYDLSNIKTDVLLIRGGADKLSNVLWIMEQIPHAEDHCIQAWSHLCPLARKGARDAVFPIIVGALENAAAKKARRLPPSLVRSATAAEARSKEGVPPHSLRLTSPLSPTKRGKLQYRPAI